jgi:hypothetical protein
MLKIMAAALLTLTLVYLAIAAGPCPITLLSGVGDTDVFTVTFRIRGKLPIRRLEFNCIPVHRQINKSQSAHCVEENSYFLSGNEYTVRYGYPGGKPTAIVVSLKNVLLANGMAWKPTKAERCRVLRIQPK